MILSWKKLNGLFSCNWAGIGRNVETQSLIKKLVLNIKTFYY